MNDGLSAKRLSHFIRMLSVDHDFAEDDVEESPPSVGNSSRLDVHVAALHRLRAVEVESWKRKWNSQKSSEN